jgi:hypothetical protein
MSSTDRPVLHTLRIRLADDEWGNELMTQLAAESLADPHYGTYQPLVVSVFEHAGWWLEFALLEDRTTAVASANDLAMFREAAGRFRDQFHNASVTLVGNIRRETKNRCTA